MSIARLIELHQGIVSIGMPTATGQHTPPRIATAILSLPLGLGDIVETLRDALVGGFGIENGLERPKLMGCFDIAPVVLFSFSGARCVAIPTALAVTTMPRLEHIEIEPFSIVPPCSGTGATKGMIGDKVILVILTNGGGQCLPHFGLHIATLITADDPHDVRTMAIPFGEELTIGLSLFDVHQPSLDKTAPDADHTDVDSALFCLIEDVVEMVPIGVGILQRALRFLVIGREVEQISLLVGNHRRLTIHIVGRHTIDSLHLDHIIPSIGTLGQVEAHLGTIEFFRHQPARLPLPEERSAIGMLEIEMIIADLQTAMRPGFLSGLRYNNSNSCTKEEKKGQKSSFHECLRIEG